MSPAPRDQLRNCYQGNHLPTTGQIDICHPSNACPLLSNAFAYNRNILYSWRVGVERYWLASHWCFVSSQQTYIWRLRLCRRYFLVRWNHYLRLLELARFGARGGRFGHQLPWTWVLVAFSPVWHRSQEGSLTLFPVHFRYPEETWALHLGPCSCWRHLYERGEEHTTVTLPEKRWMNELQWGDRSDRWPHLIFLFCLMKNSYCRWMRVNRFPCVL